MSDEDDTDSPPFASTLAAMRGFLLHRLVERRAQADRQVSDRQGIELGGDRQLRLGQVLLEVRDGALPRELRRSFLVARR